MRHSLKTLAAAALVTPFVAGCATKGFVRKELAVQRTQIDSSIAGVSSAVAMERAERMAGDSLLRGELTQLRQDLTTLRTDFGARIDTIAQGLQFAFPVNFAFDDATVRDTDRAGLEKFARVVQRYYGGSKITVEGFADPAGSTRYNLNLSRRRADAVREFLASQGLANEQVATVGYGEARQVVAGAQKDDPGAEQNRRVVFVIESRGPATTPVATAAQP
jgi:outer membrane protein OmpA-like peptidoglycan-associated protein